MSSSPPGTVSGVTHEFTVATGRAAASAPDSKTPMLRRSDSMPRSNAMLSSLGSGARNPRASARRKAAVSASEEASMVR
jgi:hypothetical protein